MASLPDSTFEPNEVVTTIGQSPADETDASLFGFPKGSIVSEVERVTCRFVKGTDQTVGNLPNGCTYYKIQRKCSTDTEWWDGAKLLWTTKDHGGPSEKTDWVIVMHCADGSVTMVTDKWLMAFFLEDGSFLLGNSASSRRDIGVGVVETRTPIEKLTYSPPPEILGCFVKGYFQKFWRITKVRSPGNIPVGEPIDVPWAPSSISPQTYRIPGCKDPEPIILVPEPHGGEEVKDTRLQWNPAAQVSVVGPHIRVRFEISERLHKHGDVRAELSRFLSTSVSEVMPSIVEALTKPSSSGGAKEGKAVRGRRPTVVPKKPAR